MKRPPKAGFLLVARREWRWLFHDRLALILIFGVPLFAFVVLTAVFSHPVIRGLVVVVVNSEVPKLRKAPSNGRSCEAMAGVEGLEPPTPGFGVRQWQ